MNALPSALYIVVLQQLPLRRLRLLHALSSQSLDRDLNLPGIIVTGEFDLIVELAPLWHVIRPPVQVYHRKTEGSVLQVRGQDRYAWLALDGAGGRVEALDLEKPGICVDEGGTAARRDRSGLETPGSGSTLDSATKGSAEYFSVSWSETRITARTLPSLAVSHCSLSASSCS